jgi:hypothetical protein
MCGDMSWFGWGGGLIDIRQIADRHPTTWVGSSDQVVG